MLIFDMASHVFTGFEATATVRAVLWMVVRFFVFAAGFVRNKVTTLGIQKILTYRCDGA